MSENISSSRRIAQNTIILYMRMIVIMLLNLYIVRLVINTLGVTDYGIYDVVAGVVTMFSCISSVFASSIQRFYSFYLGKGDGDQLNKIFNTYLFIFIIIVIIILLLGETLGLWFIKNRLVYPEERATAVNVIYQLSLFTFIILLLNSSFFSIIIAFEKLNLFAIISLIEVFLKLLLLIILKHINFGDKLIYYGIILFVGAIVGLSMYLYSVKRWIPYKFKIIRLKDFSMFKSLLTFSSWSLFTSVASLSIMQVCTIFVNIFFGPVVNAYRAIALQVNSALSSFIGNYQMAFRAPLIKEYAKNNFKSVDNLFYICNKLIFYSLLMLCIPIYFNMSYILDIWINNTNEQAVLYSRIIIFYVLIMSLSNPIAMIMHAVGKLKEFSIKVESITLLSAPLTYIAFKSGYPVVATFIIMVILAILAHIVRMYCLRKYYPSFSIGRYLKEFISRGIMITIVVVVLQYLFKDLFLHSFLQLLFSCTLSIISVLILCYSIALNRRERMFINNKIVHFVNIIKSKSGYRFK